MITTENGEHLKIFDDGVKINSELPKWKNAQKRAEPKKLAYVQVEPDDGTSGGPMVMTNNTMTTPWDVDEDHLTRVDFDETAKLKIKDLTAFINDYGVSKIYGNSYNQWFGNTVQINAKPGPEQSKRVTWFSRLINAAKKKKERTVWEFSILDFFSNVKLAGKESADTYKDRVGKYLEALATATITGQIALKEKLARGMFVNKYEAELYANGFYHVVTEKQVADFAKKTEEGGKGLELIYIKNFSRPLPEKVVNKLLEADKMEVFDNYVILAYDPEGKKKIETEKERDKRKDPILFGVIAGSDKLYYITDWVDEYCDLTLQQFVDTLGIKKADLKMK